MSRRAVVCSIILMMVLPGVYAQQAPLKRLSNSKFTFIYRMDSAEAWTFLSTGRIDPHARCFSHKVDSLRNDTAWPACTLAPGHYLQVHTQGTKANYTYLYEPFLQLMVAGINKELQLRVYEPGGNLLTGARVFTDKAEVLEDTLCHCFHFSSTQNRNERLRVYGAGQFVTGNLGNDYQPPKPVYDFDRGGDYSHSYGGYMVTNKPRYFPKDTVRLKAFLLYADGSVVRTRVSLELYDIYYGKTYPLGKLHTVSAGAYVHDFVLGDSLTLDRHYDLRIKDEDGYVMKTTRFKLEDYVLMKNTFEAGITKPAFAAKEKVQFYMRAYDANGLPVPDAKVKLRLRMTHFEQNLEPYLEVPDSWNTVFWEHTYVLDEGQKVLTLPDSIFPRARMQLMAEIRFTDGNNELHSKDIAFNLNGQEGYYVLELSDSNTLEARHIYNGHSTGGYASLRAWRDNELLGTFACSFPCSAIPDPLATRYELLDSNKNPVAVVDIKDKIHERVFFTGERRNDSVFVQLQNPDNLDVFVRFFSENRETGQAYGKRLFYNARIKGKRSFRLVYTYLQGGKTRVHEQAFHVYEKGLNIETDMPDEVLPGQTVMVQLRVLDYRKRPVKNVNLAAWAVNSSFDETVVPELPYMGRSFSPMLQHNDATFKRIAGGSGTLPVNRDLLSRGGFLLHDSLLAFLYPRGGYAEKRDSMTHRQPEFAPFVFREGERQQVFAIYVDGKPVYIQDVNQLCPYSFVCSSGKHQLRIRTAACSYTIDSVLFSDSTRLIVSIDQLLRPRWVKCDSAQKAYELDTKECDDLLKYTLFLWRGEKEPGHNDFLEQNGRCMYLREERGTLNYNYKLAKYRFYGPFEPGFVKLYIGDKDSAEFLFAPGFAYQFSNGQVSRIPHPEKAFLFRFLKGDYYPFAGEQLSQLAHRLPQKAAEHAANNNENRQEEYPTEKYPHSDVQFNANAGKQLAGRVEICFAHGAGVRNIWFINTAQMPNTLLSYYAGGVYNEHNMQFALAPGQYRLLITDLKGRVFEREQLNVRADVRLLLRPDTAAFTHNWDYIQPVLRFIQQLEDNQSFLNATHYNVNRFVMHSAPFEIRQVTIIDHKTGIAGFVFNEYGRVPRVIITAENEWKKIEGFALSAADGFFDMIDLPPGIYTLRLTSPDHKVLIIDRLSVKAGLRTYIKVRLLSDAEALRYTDEKTRYEANEALIQTGTGEIQGKVIDEKTRKPLDFVNIVIKKNGEVRGSAFTDENGNYIFKYLVPGTYVLEASYVGYQKIMITNIRVQADRIEFVNVETTNSGVSLKEVKIIARKTPIIDPTGKGGETFSADEIIKMPARSVNSIATIEAGVISVNGGSPVFRGSRADGTAYYIDGVRVVGGVNLPKNAIDQVQLGGREAPDKWATPQGELKSKYTSATLGQISGLKEVNRVRNSFRDYAYWQPNHITGKDGVVRFAVQFPDNITGWRNIVLAMDGRLHSGSRVTFTRSFKPLSAALVLPRFMVQGDSACLVGRTLNYINEPVDVQLIFCNGRDTLQHSNATITQYNLQNLPLVTPRADSLKLTYALQTAKGYRDGEEHILPVLSGAIAISQSSFEELKGDTQFTVTVPAGCASVKLLFSNRKIEQLREEIQKLKQYRYGCTEQTASKLKALLLEKNLGSLLGDTFTGEEDIETCMNRLARYQLQNGSWGWWSGNNAENWLSLYAMEALNMAEKNGYHGQAFLRGLTYLKNNITGFGHIEQLKALLLLEENKAQLDYRDWIRRIDEATITSPDVNVSMLLILLRSKLGMETDAGVVYKGMREDDYGGVFWNAASPYLAYRGSYTTLLAYKCLTATHADSELVQRVRKHFLHPRGFAGYYRNTLETSSILEAMLLDEASGNAQPLTSTLQLRGKKNITTTTLPERTELKPGDTLHISKQGGAMDFARWDYRLIQNPEHKNERFELSTSFRQKGKTTDILQQSEPAEMIVHVNAYSAGEYLMLDVPVPAGCFYGEKTNNAAGWEVHREYFKNSTAIFIRNLPRGQYDFVIKLDPRFTGRYVLPAVQMQSMYDPDVTGNNTKRMVWVVK